MHFILGALRVKEAFASGSDHKMPDDIPNNTITLHIYSTDRLADIVVGSYRYLKSVLVFNLMLHLFSNQCYTLCSWFCELVSELICFDLWLVKYT